MKQKGRGGRRDYRWQDQSSSLCVKTKGRGTGIKHQNKDRDKRGECLQVILEEAHNLLKSQEGIDWRQGKLMILGESTGVYIPEEEAGPYDWGCPYDPDNHMIQGIHMLMALSPWETEWLR